MSWTPNIQAAIDIANAAQSAAAATLAAAGTYDDTGASMDFSSMFSGATTTGDSLYDGLGNYASGGEVSGPGWFMAGENGAEPVFLKRGEGANVTSNGNFTGSMDRNAQVTASGLSALLTEMRGMRAELSQIRSTGQRAASAPAR